MKAITAHAACTGCHACFSICPANAISMVPDEEGFLYPIIDKELCNDCNLCTNICPVNRKAEASITESDVLSEAYTSLHRDERIRYESSSGGAFSALAETVISHKGVVFGARFDERFKIIHDYIETIDYLPKLRGSKYTQSEIGSCMLEVRDFLQQGRLVLFSGTPCQVEGMLSFLGKPYENLFTVDLICHGVPSPMVWQKYLEYRKKKDGCMPEKITFRDKRLGSSYILFRLTI